MTPRDELIERWQARLAETQSSPPGDSPHGQWVRKVYARIYRFLLACYAHTPWPTEPARDDESQTTAAASTQLLLSPEGKRPKDAGQIGKVLKAVHAANGQGARVVRPGMAKMAVDKDAWIRAAEFKYGKLASRFYRLLHRQGIVSRIVHLTGHYFVEVRRADFDAAMAVMQSHREELSHAENRRPATAATTRPRNLRGVLIALVCVGSLGLIPFGVELTRAFHKSPSAAIVTIATIFVVSVALWCVWCASTIRRL